MEKVAERGLILFPRSTQHEAMDFKCYKDGLS